MLKRPLRPLPREAKRRSGDTEGVQSVYICGWVPCRNMLFVRFFLCVCASLCKNMRSNYYRFFSIFVFCCWMLEYFCCKVTSELISLLLGDNFSANMFQPLGEDLFGTEWRKETISEEAKTSIKRRFMSPRKKHFGKTPKIQGVLPGFTV